VSPVAKYIIETLVTLLAVIALAVLVLTAARRIGVGRAGGPLELVGRLPLDGRRAVYLVRVDKIVYVIAASEAGLAKLGELGADAIALGAVEPVRSSFADVLARVLRRPRQARHEEPKREEDA
jgi:flagellar biogenesis protein FliO